MPGDGCEREQRGKGEVAVAQRIALEAGQSTGIATALVGVAESHARKGQGRTRAHHHEDVRSGGVVESEGHPADEGRIERCSAKGAAQQQRLPAREGTATRQAIADDDHPRNVDESALHVDCERGAQVCPPPAGRGAAVRSGSGKQAQKPYRHQHRENRVVVAQEVARREARCPRIAEQEGKPPNHDQHARLPAHRPRNPWPQQRHRQ